ncbi:MAG: acetoin utilization protein AcuC [Pseudomonadota bacterium]
MEKINGESTIAGKAAKRAFIYSDAWRLSHLPEGHPWRGERARATFEMATRLGLFKDDVILLEPEAAPEQALLSFHKPRYLEMLRKANRGEATEEMLRYGLGTMDCPVFPGVYDYSRLVVGGTLLGAELIERGEAAVVFSPVGGLHHGGDAFAAGFCYLNDVALAINRLLRRGRRVLYVDLDAHHGDQVQAAYWRDDRVLTISFHESTRTLFPWKGGFETEIGEGRGKGYSVNVPLLENTTDDEFLYAFERIFPPLAGRFQPDVVVAQLGIDSHYQDPLSHLRLTNLSHGKAVARIVEMSPRLLALGGGGYNTRATSRGWTLAWAVMLGIDPDEYADGFGGMFWGDNLAALKDRPQFVPPDLRRPAEEQAQRVVKYIEEHVFPLQGRGVEPD